MKFDFMAKEPATSTSFEQIVARVMADWSALQIAVDNSLGGELSKEKARWLVEVTSDFITKTDDGMF